MSILNSLTGLLRRWRKSAPVDDPPPAPMVGPPPTPVPFAVVPPGATLNDAITVVTGGPTLNEGMFQYFLAGGAIGLTLQDLERSYLEARTPHRGPLQEMWFDMLYAMGYSGTLSDMQLQYWLDQGGTVISVITKDFTGIWGQISVASVGYRLSPAVGSLAPDNTFAGGSIASFAVTDADWVYVIPQGGAQFPDITAEGIWFSQMPFTPGESFQMQWYIDRYEVVLPGAYARAVSNIGLPTRFRLSGNKI